MPGLQSLGWQVTGRGGSTLAIVVTEGYLGVLKPKN